MKLRLYTETVVDGAHQLRGYDGACSRLHGHSWKISVWTEGSSDQVDKVGILMDFGKLKDLKDILDHRCINEIEPFDKINPTAENLVQYVFKYFHTLYPSLQFCIRIYETYVGKTTYCQAGDFCVEGMS